MRTVRFTKRFDFRPDASTVMAYKEGDEREVTEAIFAEAEAAGAVEVIDVKGPRAREAAEEAAASSAKSSRTNR